MQYVQTICINHIYTPQKPAIRNESIYILSTIYLLRGHIHVGPMVRVFDFCLSLSNVENYTSHNNKSFINSLTCK